MKHQGSGKIIIPGSSQSNRDRTKLIALRRLGMVEDCAKVVEFLATAPGVADCAAIGPYQGETRGRARLAAPDGSLTAGA